MVSIFPLLIIDRQCQSAPGACLFHFGLYNQFEGAAVCRLPRVFEQILRRKREMEKGSFLPSYLAAEQDLSGGPVDKEDQVSNSRK